MSPLTTVEDLHHELSRHLCIAFTRSLLESANLAESMEMILPGVGRVFRTPKVILIDYREHTDHFVLLHYEGYAEPNAHYSLQRRMPKMELRRALDVRRPYSSSLDSRFLCIPLYFRDILEAVLILESESSIELDDIRVECSRVISANLGLLMSSTRLKVNQDHLVDVNDLKQARQIQLSFLPGPQPESEFCEVFGYNRSSALVGGDYFDYFCTRRGSIQGVLADACGHGMSAALIASTFRGLLHAEMGRRRDDFDGLFDAINSSVHAGDEFIRYLTSVFFDYREESRTFRYLNAGHYDPLVFARDGDVRRLPGGGPPLGMFKTSVYSLGQARLFKDDLIVLFSDGLIDIQDSAGGYFGVDGLVEALQGHRDRSLSEICKAVLQQAAEKSERQGIDDDVTLFLMRVR